MKRVDLLKYLLASLFAIFSGAVILRQFTLFRYFYNSSTGDFLIIALLIVLSSFLTFKYPNLHGFALRLIGIITLIIGVVAFKLSYSTFQYFDVPDIISYLFSALFPVCIISSLKKQEYGIYAYGVVFMSAVAGSFVQYFIDNMMFIWSLSLLCIVLDFTISFSESEGNYTPAYSYGMLFMFLVILYRILNTSTPFYESQKSYYDKVIYSQHTPFQRIDVTEWKGEKWYYCNGINSFCTIDQWLFYEPLIHPIMEIAQTTEKILVIGGDNGLAVRELLKHDNVIKIDQLVLDTTLYRLASSSELFTSINKNSLINDKVNAQYHDVFRHLNSHLSAYDIIIIDVPDPVDIEINEYYTKEFYELCYNALSNDGAIITQAGSPYFATQAYYCISNTVRAAQFSVLEMHNQVLTMGEWGWIIGTKNLDSTQLRYVTKALNFDHLTTVWLNNEAMNMMLSFGKTNMVINDTIINTLKQPVVQMYYTRGTSSFNQK